MSSVDHAIVIGPLGTAATFEKSVRQLLPALRGYARRLTRDRTDSEDLVQETLLRAWAARDQFIANTNFRAWLFRIEYNCFISSLRKMRRWVQLDPVAVEWRLPSPAMQEEGLMMRDFDIALASLPEQQSDTFALINDQGLSYEDAAEQLGVAVGTVKSRVRRARSTLTRYLAGDSSGPSIARSGPSEIAGGKPYESHPVAVSVPSRSGVYAAWKASGQRRIG